MVRSKQLTIVYTFVLLLMVSCTGGVYTLDECYEEIDTATKKLNEETYVWLSNELSRYVKNLDIIADDDFKKIAMHVLDTDYILDLENGPYPIEFNNFINGRKAVSLIKFENHIINYKKNISDIYYITPSSKIIDENYANPFSNFLIKYNTDPYLYAFAVSERINYSFYMPVSPDRMIWNELQEMFLKTNTELINLEFLMNRLDTLEKFEIIDIKLNKENNEYFSLNKYTESLEYRKTILNDIDYLFRTHPECLDIGKFKYYPSIIRTDYQYVSDELNAINSDSFTGPSGFSVPTYDSN